MKKLICIALTLIFLASCAPKNQVKITGDIAGLENGMIYLKIRENKQWKSLDSCMAENGKFALKAIVEEPKMAYLIIKSETLPPHIPVFIEPGKINISGSENQKMIITGSNIHNEYEKYLQSKEAFSEQYETLAEAYYEAKKQGDTASLVKMQAQMDDIDRREKAFQEAYVAANPTSHVALYVITSELIYTAELKDLENYKNQMGAALKETASMKEIDSRMEVLRTLNVGQLAPPISLPDTSGNIRNLSDFRGKYVLVDFWASWCTPCRAENPNVVAAYEKYHPQGLEIFAISLDDNKNRWTQAIADDHLTWTHVSELKKWNGQTTTTYGIISIPSNVLIDPDGNIVARNIFADNLQQKLAEIFN